jgi:hypothetical protein
MFMKTYPRSNKNWMLAQGTPKSGNEDKDIVMETMHKEGKHSHLLRIHSILWHSSYNSSGIKLKKSSPQSSSYLTCIGSMKLYDNDQLMNQDADMNKNNRSHLGIWRRFSCMTSTTQGLLPNGWIYIVLSLVSLFFFGIRVFVWAYLNRAIRWDAESAVDGSMTI